MRPRNVALRGRKVVENASRTCVQVTDYNNGDRVSGVVHRTGRQRDATASISSASVDVLGASKARQQVANPTHGMSDCA